MPDFHFLSPPGLGIVPVWQWLIVTWFGAGLVVPFRAGLAILALIPLLLLAIKLPKYIVPVLATALFFVGVYASAAIDLATGISDDRRIVIDEVAAFLIGASLVRQAGWRMLLPYAALFLLLDRLKPWPISYIERVPSGWGVMLDDLFPAIALGLIFALIQRLSNRRSR